MCNETVTKAQIDDEKSVNRGSYNSTYQQLVIMTMPYRYLLLKIVACYC